MNVSLQGLTTVASAISATVLNALWQDALLVLCVWLLLRLWPGVNAATRYSVRLSEDVYSRNMSYLKNNERYTIGTGGGEESSNFVNISGVCLLYADSVETAITATGAAAR